MSSFTIYDLKCRRTFQPAVCEDRRHETNVESVRPERHPKCTKSIMVLVKKLLEERDDHLHQLTAEREKVRQAVERQVADLKAAHIAEIQAVRRQLDTG